MSAKILSEYCPRHPDQKRHRNKPRRRNTAGEWYCPMCSREQRQPAERRLKYEVLQHYSVSSVPVCACPGCGEKRLEFLAVDHIDGGGGKHRKAVGGGGHNFYSWLKRNDYPPGY